MTMRGYDRPNPSMTMNRLRRLARNIVFGISWFFRGIWPLARLFLVSFLVIFLYTGATLGALLAFAGAFMAYGVLAGLLALSLVASIGAVSLAWVFENS